METAKLINIEITKNEAIVLFDFLARFNEIEENPVFVDQSEQRILWNLECILETKIEESFGSDYEKLVKQAREIIRDKE